MRAIPGLDIPKGYATFALFPDGFKCPEGTGSFEGYGEISAHSFLRLLVYSQAISSGNQPLMAKSILIMCRVFAGCLTRLIMAADWRAAVGK